MSPEPPSTSGWAANSGKTSQFWVNYRFNIYTLANVKRKAVHKSNHRINVLTCGNVWKGSFFGQGLNEHGKFALLRWKCSHQQRLCAHSWRTRGAKKTSFGNEARAACPAKLPPFERSENRGVWPLKIWSPFDLRRCDCPENPLNISGSLWLDFF